MCCRRATTFITTSAFTSLVRSARSGNSNVHLSRPKPTSDNNWKGNSANRPQLPVVATINWEPTLVAQRVSLVLVRLVGVTCLPRSRVRCKCRGVRTIAALQLRVEVWDCPKLLVGKTRSRDWHLRVECEEEALEPISWMAVTRRVTLA